MQKIIFDKNIIIIVVKIIMAILAVVCIIVESQFNYPKIREYLGDPFAFLLSILLPIFTSFAVEASAILRKQGVKMAAFALMFAALFSMLFSITMIVRGQYDKQIANMNNTIETREEEKTDTTIYDLKVKQLKDKEQSIERTSKEVSRLDDILEKNPNDTNTYWARYRENEDLKKQESERDILNAEIEKLLTGGSVTQEKKEERTFDQWFAGLINWSPDSVKMFLYLILPIFITIIAPLGIYFSLGLYENTEIKKRIKKQPVQRKQNLKKYIEIWVQYNWMALKNGYNKIIPKNTFIEFMKNKGIEFDASAYDDVYRLSEKTGCTKDGIIIELNDAESIKKMLTNSGK